MDLEPWIHFAHVTGAVLWVGGGVMLSLVALRTRRSEDPAAVASFAGLLSYAGLRVFTPSVVVVLASGIWLVLDHSGDFTRLWIILALAAFAAAFLIGAVYLSRTALQLQRLATAAPDLPAARAAIGRWLVGYAVVLAILIFAIWDMVLKPTL